MEEKDQEKLEELKEVEIKVKNDDHSGLLEAEEKTELLSRNTEGPLWLEGVSRSRSMGGGRFKVTKNVLSFACCFCALRLQAGMLLRLVADLV